MQLQSRLRDFWVDHGVKGSSFGVRNVAEGGGYSTKHQGPLLSALSTENHDYFSLTAQRIRNETNKEKEAMIDRDDHYRFLTAGHPIYDIDVHGSDNTMCDGAASVAERESHLRLTALLNGIWIRQSNANGIEVKKQCQHNWTDLVPKMANWGTNGRTKERFPFIPHYIDSEMSVGILDIQQPFGMQGVCPTKEGTEGTMKDGFYSNMMVNWHPSTHGHRVMADILSFWMLESAKNFLEEHLDEILSLRDYAEFQRFLKRESGEWKEKLLHSIRSGDIVKYKERVNTSVLNQGLAQNMFPRPLFCGKPNGQCISGLPFSLTAWSPQTFNTHFRMRDYIVNPVPFEHVQRDLGWSKVSGQPSIKSIELREGWPANMDDKFTFRCDRSFLAQKWEELQNAATPKAVTPKVALDQMSNDQVDALHQHLIAQRLFLQFVVKVPVFGNGTVWIDSGANNQSIKYVAKMDDASLGQKSLAFWQGLEPGNKYKLTVVPYDVRDKKANCRFGNIYAF